MFWKQIGVIGILLLAGCMPKVCFEDKCFKVEKAKTTKELSTGLMFRESLEEGKGMLFIFKQVGVYPFWMKNTLMPLDIIWINSKKEVVHIARDVQPCRETCESIDPGVKAKYVLEVNAGEANKLKERDLAEIIT